MRIASSGAREADRVEEEVEVAFFSTGCVRAISSASLAQAPAVHSSDRDGMRIDSGMRCWC